jgi:pseudouridine synthase
VTEAKGDRLQKALAHAGLGSRRAMEELIAAGRVTVNGEVAELGRRVDTHNDVVEVDGSRVPLAPDLVYYLLNKPPGVVVSADDERGRQTVYDLVDSGERIWAVGRLDIESEGALILTNDGDLTEHLTHPRYAVPKTYLAWVKGKPDSKALRALARGVELEDGKTAPAEVDLVESAGGASLVELTITEGRNRQVRRMMDAVGHPVIRLARTSIGALSLGHLRPGAARRLGPVEVQALYKETGQ